MKSLKTVMILFLFHGITLSASEIDVFAQGNREALGLILGKGGIEDFSPKPDRTRYLSLEEIAAFVLPGYEERKGKWEPVSLESPTPDCSPAFFQSASPVLRYNSVKGYASTVCHICKKSFSSYDPRAVEKLQKLCEKHRAVCKLPSDGIDEVSKLENDKKRSRKE